MTSISRGIFRGVFINQAPEIGCQGIPFAVTGTNFSVQGDVSGFGMSTPWLMRRNGVTTTGFDFFGQ